MTDARYAKRRDAEVMASLRPGYAAERAEDGYWYVIPAASLPTEAPATAPTEPAVAPTEPAAVQRRGVPGNRRRPR